LAHPDSLQAFTKLIRNTQFLRSAHQLNQLPTDTGAEVAFAGRSNAGKSSVLNTLCQHGNLARVSKTPGRTRLINLFELPQGNGRLVDLPGYGYAEVQRELKDHWGQELAAYFLQRQSLRGLILIVDIRQGITPHDDMMLGFVESRDLPCHILLNKADKLSRSQAMVAEREIRKLLPSHYGLQCFSALKKDGVEACYRALMPWLKS
jgi:GTP-binding protein